MKKKIIFLSLVVAILIALLPISSVVGTGGLKSVNKKATSPLFGNHYASDGNQITSSYLGKGKISNLFFSKLSFRNSIQRAYRFVQNNPGTIDRIIDRIEDNEKIADILAEYDITKTEYKQQLNLIRQDPSLLEKDFETAMQNMDEMSPVFPTGMNTTNPFAVLIVVIALLPVFLIIGVLIATMTLVTCLNIGGCFESLTGGLIENLIQGLKSPDDII